LRTHQVAMSEDTGSESGSNAPAVSAATPLYPVALAYNLDLGQLAAAPAMRSCFLCTQVRMEPMKVAVFAKQLCEQTIFTVGDYLGTDHATVNAKVLSLKCVSTLDGYLKQFAGLPENRHAALEEPDDTMSTVERVEWWCNVHGSFSTWSAKTVLEYMHREARDIHDRLRAAVAGTSSAAVEGKHLAAAKPRALRALIGDDDPDDWMFKRLRALIRLAKSVVPPGMLWSCALRAQPLFALTRSVHTSNGRPP